VQRGAAASFIDRCGESASARRNFVFGPRTLTTGASPIVFVTNAAPPRVERAQDVRLGLVGGADDRRKGFESARR